MAEVKLAQFAPDAGEASTSTIRARDCLSTQTPDGRATEFHPLPSLVEYIPGLGDVIERRGGNLLNLYATEEYIYVITDLEILRVDTSTENLSDTERIGVVTVYGSSEDDAQNGAGSFIEWGDSLLVASGSAHNVQRVILETGSRQNLPGSPRARLISSLQGRVFLGNTEGTQIGVDDDGDPIIEESKNILWASNIAGGGFDFTLGETGTSNRFTISELDEITNLASTGEELIIFGRDKTFSLYGRPGDISIDRIGEHVGCPGAHASVSFNNNVYFASLAGFHMTDGSRVVPIGTNRVDSTFQSLVRERFAEIRTGVLDDNQTVFFTCPGAEIDKVWYYNTSNDRWSTGTDDIEATTTLPPRELTLEQLDNYGGRQRTIDDLPASLDSPLYREGTFISGAMVRVNNRLEIRAFAGLRKTADIQVGAWNPSQGQNTFLRKVYPLVSGQGHTVSVIDNVRDSLAAVPRQNQPSLVNRYNFAPVQELGRYHSLRFIIWGDERGMIPQGLSQTQTQSAGGRWEVFGSYNPDFTIIGER